VNRHFAIRVSRQSWAVAIGFLVAFCWIGWAAVRFGSVFEGMDILRSLPTVNRLALTYGPVAFPLFGVVVAATFVLSDFMFHKRWIAWALFVAFALLAVCAFRGLLVSGVFMVPTSPANHSMQRMRASRLRQSQIERPWRLARTADGRR